jgi:hypothetical protein
MMRFVLVVFMFMSAGVVNAQIRLKVFIHDEFDWGGVENTYVSIGDQGRYANGDGLVEFRHVTPEMLDDSLTFFHPNYEIEDRAFTDCDYYFLVEGGIGIDITAKERIQREIKLSLNIAEKGKEVSDSVGMLIYCPQSNKHVSYFNKKGKLIHDFGMTVTMPSAHLAFYSKLAYNKIEDGYFKVVGEYETKTYPFKKEDCFYPIYLTDYPVGGMDKRELELLQRYIREQKESKETLREQKNKSQETIDSLNYIIDELRGVEILEEEFPPPPQIMAASHKRPYAEAFPYGGIELMEQKLNWGLKDFSVPNSGNVTLKFTVLRSGMLDISVLHAHRSMNGLIEKLSGILSEKWNVASAHGRMVKQQFLLSVEVNEQV